MEIVGKILCAIAALPLVYVAWSTFHLSVLARDEDWLANVPNRTPAIVGKARTTAMCTGLIAIAMVLVCLAVITH